MLKLEKKLKIIISILIIIIMLIGIIIYIYLKQNNTKIGITEQNEIIDEIGVENTRELEKTFQLVSIRNDYYVIETCINDLYTHYVDIFDTTITEESQKENEEHIYNMLDLEYINSMGITKNNIKSKLSKMNDFVIDINNMYVSEITSNIDLYYIQGNLRDTSTDKITQFKLMVRLDKTNKTFSVFLQDYIDEKYPDLKIGDSIDIVELSYNIQANEANTYSYKHILDEEYCIDLFGKYKEEILYNVELLYSRLDLEYRQKRFPTIKDFNDYIKKIGNRINTVGISKYSVETEENYTKYVLIDNYNNYYIIKEDAVMNFTIQLDNYTIKYDNYEEDYNKLTQAEKLSTDLNIFISMVNNKDYSAIYEILDESYKKSNFATVEKLEKYIDNNFFESNIISDSDYKFRNEGEYNIYTIKIKSGNTVNALEKTLTVIIKLEEGTGFKISFSIS